MWAERVWRGEDGLPLGPGARGERLGAVGGGAAYTLRGCALRASAKHFWHLHPRCMLLLAPSLKDLALKTKIAERPIDGGSDRRRGGRGRCCAGAVRGLVELGRARTPPPLLSYNST